MAYKGAQNAADAQDAANRETERQLIAEQGRAVMDGERQAQQQYETAAAETNAYGMEVVKARGAYDALIGEGFGGNSGDRKLATMGIRQGQDLATIASNARKSAAEVQMGTANSVNATGQKFASLRPGDRPSALGAVLQLGGAAIDYKTSMNKINKEAKPKVT
jgi:hypothetical protein